MVDAVPHDSSYSTHDYTATDYGVSSSESFIGRHSADMYFESDRSLCEEHDRVRSLTIGGEAHERVDDDGDGNDDDHDDGEDAGDEEQLVPLAPASGSDGRPRQGKGLTGSFMSVMNPVEGGPVDPELILSYGGHVDRGVLKYRSRYMALTGWNLIDVHVVSLATRTGLMHLQSCIFQHPNSVLLSVFVERW
ncbi:hypothetical protein M9H77_35163 [Catharanthus roseus]|uniref:Uncharacterized protein n=1 Tax=Catharanthus roseus TaxID=4058 RepID=A0ACB9ZNI5_CATRO|nr:hypothetical protein M9H77_35163 [Catharanthus roseus]